MANKFLHSLGRIYFYGQTVINFTDLTVYLFTVSTVFQNTVELYVNLRSGLSQSGPYLSVQFGLYWNVLNFNFILLRYSLIANSMVQAVTG